MSNIAHLIPPSAEPEKARYRLLVLNSPESGPRIQVLDCERGCEVFDWQGREARHLLDSGELHCLKTRRYGYHPCDKQTVWHLALIAAAARSVCRALSPTRLAESYALARLTSTTPAKMSPAAR